MSDDVRARFKTFMQARLTSDRARAEWRAELERGWAMLLETKLLALVEPASLLKAVENATRREAFEKVVAPVFVAGRKDIFPIVKSNDDTLGTYVPKDARDAIDELLGKPGFMHDKLVEEIMKQEVVEEIMRDILSDALEEFNDKVNPFFADWGLPGLIKKFVPIGGGAVLRSIESVRGEYDKRLKPEIKKFLQGFSRRALDKTAKAIIARADDPQSVALRRALAKWLWEQKVKDLVANVDDEKWALGEKAGLLIAQQTAQTKRVQDARNDLVYAFFKKHDGHTVKEALAAYGVDPVLDFDILAEATWPAVKAIATSEVAMSYVAGIVAEFVASEARGPASQG
jgi:hypothetical protein